MTNERTGAFTISPSLKKETKVEINTKSARNLLQMVPLYCDSISERGKNLKGPITGCRWAQQYINFFRLQKLCYR